MILGWFCTAGTETEKMPIAVRVQLSWQHFHVVLIPRLCQDRIGRACRASLLTKIRPSILLRRPSAPRYRPRKGWRESGVRKSQSTLCFLYSDRSETDREDQGKRVSVPETSPAAKACS